MKKILSISIAFVLSSISLFAQMNIAENINVKTKLGFDSEYIHRGRKLGQNIADCDMNISYQINDDIIFNIGGKLRQELSPAYTTGNKIHGMFGKQFQASFSTYILYIMSEYKINDTYTVFGGYSHFYYPKMQILNDDMAKATATHPVLKKAMYLGTDAHANEVFFGGWANVIFRPTVKLTYNIDYKEIVLEGHAYVKKSLIGIGLPKLTFFMDNYIGGDKANKPYGINRDCPFWSGKMPLGKINGRKGYVFFGSNVNLIYALNAYSEIKIGVNYAGNTNSKKSWTNFTGWGSKNGVRNMIWWNASVDVNF